MLVAPNEERIAQQIAELLNKHNNLRGKYSPSKILKTTDRYFYEDFGGMVLAAVSLLRVNDSFSEIRHLVVRPQFRELHLGSLLVEKTIRNCKTPFYYARVRADNVASNALFTKLGLQYVLQLKDQAGNETIRIYLGLR